MKKYITIAALLAAGTAFANAAEETTSLFDSTYGTVIGGIPNTATVTTENVGDTSDYATLTTQFAEAGKWYVSSGYNYDVGFDAATNAVNFVAGGPANKGYTDVGGIKFDLASILGDSVLESIDGNITLSFDVFRQSGNNNKNHAVYFKLFTEDKAYTSATYNSKEGDNLVTTKQSVSFDFSLEDLKSTTLVFGIFATENVTGSNTGFAMNNFELSYSTVPEPSAFGLLAGIGALALVASRRRRK